MVLRLACLVLSLLLVVLSSASNVPEAPYAPQFVYRADFRAPQLIFETGMKSYGACQNVFYHVQGRNCKERTTAFISTSSDEDVTEGLARTLLEMDQTKDTIYVYKIRADQRFYNARYSLETAAVKYNNKGKKQKAVNYLDLADQYRYQKEWMAFKEIPRTLIQQATAFPRQLAILNQKGDVSTNPYYEPLNTYANEQAFPESKKGCPPRFWQSMKTCLKKIG